jgi:hypothetical protein
MAYSFAARLKGAVNLDSVQEDLASVVQRALEPGHVCPDARRPRRKDG